MADLRGAVRAFREFPDKKILHSCTFLLTCSFLLDIVDYAMIGTTSRQSCLFYLPLARQASLLKDDLLQPVDPLLDDPALVELVRQSLATRRPSSTRTGRPSIAPDRLLRCCVVKHLKGWSFRELERQVRSNLVYRRFTRFDADATPNFTTFSRTFALLGPAVTEQIHRRVVGIAREQGVARGRKLRTDTTVVESNIHYPTDSTLLGDGIRVLGRSLKRIAAECQGGAQEVVDHGRAVKHRLLEIGRAAKSLTQAGQQRLRDSYHKLVGLTRGVVRQAQAVLKDAEAGRLKVVGDPLQVQTQTSQLRHFLPLVEKVIAQTQERLWKGNRHVVGKVLSLFEAHTQVIRKGKAHKPNELGRLVRMDEVENKIVSGYQVLEGNPADTEAWTPALAQHQACFGQPPRMATADRGYFSASNEREAQAQGVEKVALPARGRLSATRARLQKQRWFQRALRWRAGIEATISTLKHPFSMGRATYKGDTGFQRYVGWSIITKNLFSIARWRVQRRGHAPPP
ncbi:MAG TPA: ISNCY family transposase [Candidatus Methylomirabilis sp.]|nr:ISNCY family transposase [Candidatus Methylomirabilis sp.]